MLLHDFRAKSIELFVMAWFIDRWIARALLVIDLRGSRNSSPAQPQISQEWMESRFTTIWFVLKSIARSWWVMSPVYGRSSSYQHSGIASGYVSSLPVSEIWMLSCRLYAASSSNSKRQPKANLTLPLIMTRRRNTFDPCTSSTQSGLNVGRAPIPLMNGMCRFRQIRCPWRHPVEFEQANQTADFFCRSVAHSDRQIILLWTASGHGQNGVSLMGRVCSYHVAHRTSPYPSLKKNLASRMCSKAVRSCSRTKVIQADARLEITS